MGSKYQDAQQALDAFNHILRLGGWEFEYRKQVDTLSTALKRLADPDMVMEDSKMSKFKAIVVSHSWHVNSRGWNVDVIEADTEEDLENKRLRFKEKHEHSFYSHAVKMIEITPEETIKKPYRLTWKERITGVLK